MRIAALKHEIKELQDYLGPRIGYCSEEWPSNPLDKALLKDLIKLKESYYDKLMWRRRFRLLGIFLKK